MGILAVVDDARRQAGSVSAEVRAGLALARSLTSEARTLASARFNGQDARWPHSQDGCATIAWSRKRYVFRCPQIAPVKKWG